MRLPTLVINLGFPIFWMVKTSSTLWGAKSLDGFPGRGGHGGKFRWGYRNPQRWFSFSLYIYIYTLYIYIETRFNLSLSLLNIYIYIYNIIEWGEVANLGIFLEVAKKQISARTTWGLGASSIPAIFSLCKKWFEMNMGISMDLPKKRGNH